MAFLPVIGAAVASISGAISAAAPIIGVAGTILSGVGAFTQAKSASNAAKYNAQVQEISAQTATEQAAVKAGEVARRNRQVLSAGRAGALQNGLELTGSVSDVLTQQEDAGNLDYLTAVYDGSVAATGMRNNAELSRSQAKSSMTAGYIGMASNIFAGVYNQFGPRERPIRATNQLRVI